MKPVTLPILLSLVVFSTAAKAAPEWTTAPQAQSRKLGSLYATCVVKKSRPFVVSTLDAPFGDNETSARFAKVFSNECLDELVMPQLPTAPNKLDFSPLVGRGLLYEALYREDFRDDRGFSAIAAASAVQYPVVGADRPGSLGRDYRALMRIGECTVRAAPKQARALVLSKVASKQEAAAISAIRPARLACMPSAARQLAFAPAVERGMIAEPLYRLSQASQAKATGNVE